MPQDTEKKIIEFIKKSPLGVTSSEIAKFLGINRVTITKYLAVIKQKAKIDFKQFGMAKLWYIPVDLNQVLFLKDMLVGICENSDGKQLKSAIDKTSKKIGKEVSELYRRFHNTSKLSKGQLIDSVIDAMNKLGANFSLARENEDSVVFRNTKCLFGRGVKKCPMLCMTTANIIGTITAENLGYGKVQLKKTIASSGLEDEIVVHLKK